jgi:hypothetical protein
MAREVQEQAQAWFPFFYLYFSSKVKRSARSILQVPYAWVAYACGWRLCLYLATTVFANPLDCVRYRKFSCKPFTTELEVIFGYDQRLLIISQVFFVLFLLQISYNIMHLRRTKLTISRLLINLFFGIALIINLLFSQHFF